MPRSPQTPHRFRLPWGVFFFLLGFAILITVVSFYYLLPAIDAAKNANPEERRSLQAWSWLVLAVVLLILVGALLLIFRIGRFFFPRSVPPPTKTKIVDAWAESAKRLQSPESDELEDEES